MALEGCKNQEMQKIKNGIGDSFLDAYANRKIFSNKFPDIMKTNFPEFATKYRLTNNKLERQKGDIAPNIFPNYSSNPKGQYYSSHCKFQLLRFKTWKNYLDDAWGTTEPDNETFKTEWYNFLNSQYAKKTSPQLVSKDFRCIRKY